MSLHFRHPVLTKIRTFRFSLLKWSPSWRWNSQRVHAFCCQKNGVYSSKWQPAARAEGGGHLQTRGRAGSRRSVDRLCRQHERRALALSTSDDYLSLSKSVPVMCQWSLDVDTHYASFCLWGAWHENQAEIAKGYPSFQAWQTKHVNHRSSISIAGPGIVLLYIYCEPRELFLFCFVSRSTFHEFPFFF